VSWRSEERQKDTGTEQQLFPRPWEQVGNHIPFNVTPEGIKRYLDRCQEWGQYA
jgi:hypothetical protein